MGMAEQNFSLVVRGHYSKPMMLTTAYDSDISLGYGSHEAIILVAQVYCTNEDGQGKDEI